MKRVWWCQKEMHMSLVSLSTLPALDIQKAVTEPYAPNILHFCETKPTRWMEDSIIYNIKSVTVQCLTTDLTTADQSPAEAKDSNWSLCVQISSEAHRRSFPRGKARPGRDAGHSPHLEQRSKLRSYVHAPLSLAPARRVARQLCCC
jgi:hypothetical protein